MWPPTPPGGRRQRVAPVRRSITRNGSCALPRTPRSDPCANGNWLVEQSSGEHPAPRTAAGNTTAQTTSAVAIARTSERRQCGDALALTDDPQRRRVGGVAERDRRMRRALDD